MKLISDKMWIPVHGILLYFSFEKNNALINKQAKKLAFVVTNFTQHCKEE